MHVMKADCADMVGKPEVGVDRDVNDDANSVQVDEDRHSIIQRFHNDVEGHGGLTPSYTWKSPHE